MKQIKMTKKKNLSKGVMRTEEGYVNRRPLFISFVVLVVVVLAVALLFFRSGKTVAGKAYNVESTVDYSKIADSKAVYLQNAKGYAQQGDVVTIPFYVKNVVQQGELGLSQATICLKYDTTKFTLVDAKVTKGGWQWLLTDAEVMTAFTAQGKGEGNCAGFSTKVDVGKSSTGSVISTANIGDQLGVFTFKVVSDYINENPQTFTLKTIYLSGLKDAGNWNSGDINLAYSSDLLIAQKCPDTDGDGYPSISVAQAQNGVVGKDLRACPHKEPIDCNDNDKDMFPGNPEKCDGKDNDCDGNVDNGLSAGQNTNIKGVCYGTQKCVKGVWTDSYLIDDPTILFNNVKQFSLYTKDKDVCDFYDNDCDGSVNEDDVNCKIGGASVGLLPTGNTFLTYNADNTLGVQLTNPVDVSLLYVLNDVRGDTNFGDKGQKPYQAKVKGNLAWVCDSGLYYVEYKSAAGVTYEKHYHDAKKEVLAGVTKNVVGNLVINNAEIVC